MPPRGKLAEEQIADLIEWINQGAPDPRLPAPDAPSSPAESHWAFQPLKRPPLPPVRNASWVLSPLDQFILARLEKQKLAPVGDANRTELLRRASFDLIGLPPTPAEIEAFARDPGADAFVKVVDRLLSSPRYGERWGRHWMDVVRYADTAGDNADYPIPEARFYRDYIIDSFNRDKPYDQFVREQIAGDILAGRRGPYEEQVVATGFLALSRRYATAPFELWHLTLEDSIDTTGRAFLGLTLRCARCHDHKYDPVTQKDYYGLYGFFASTQYPYAGSEEFLSKDTPRSGFVPRLPPAEAAPLWQAYRTNLAALREEFRQAEQSDPLTAAIECFKEPIEAAVRRVEEMEACDDSAGLWPARAELASLEQQLEDLKRQLRQNLKPLKTKLAELQMPGLPPGVVGAYAVSEGKPADQYVQLRGEPGQQGPLVPRRFPTVFAGNTTPAIPEGGSGRLELAEWITRPEHPLTARVMVNRIWQHHFGKGIVGTPSNFGLRGEPPTHPELLDYLAGRFIESGWSVKAMHRLIMLSRTYQLSGEPHDANTARDPANRFYWRADRRRLEAEAVRDALLLVAGRLDLQRPGPHPFPPIADWKYTQHMPFKAVYDSSHRSVYLMTQRIQRHPDLALFDAPDANTSTAVRAASTVPPQALYMMNNPMVHEVATAFAQRLMQWSADPRERIRRGTELAYGRPATEAEVDQALHYLHIYQRSLLHEEAPGDQIQAKAWTSLARVLLLANEFVYID